MPDIQTFAPDLNPMTPGILVDADGVYPAEGGGIRAVPSATPYSDALAAKCLGAYSHQELDYDLRNIAGTSTALYELSGNSWVDRSRTAGYSSTNRWRFASWGNAVLATNFDDAVQSSISGDFDDLAGSPPNAKYIATSNNFVLLANLSTGGNRVHWCAQGDYTDWTPSLSTQCGYDDLDETPGPITGLAALGDYVVVFKERSLYLGTYIGPPLIWGFRRIGAFGGTPCQEAIIQTEMGLLYPSLDDFFIFDGSVPRPIGQGIRQWFFDRLDQIYMKTSLLSAYDPNRRLIFWWFPVTVEGSGEPTDCLIYDLKTGRWGRKQWQIEAALVNWLAGVTYDTIDDYYATYDDINDVTYDDPFWSQRSFSLSVFDTAHHLARLSGTPDNSNFTTGDVGNLRQITRVRGFWPYFYTEPSACTVTPRTKATLGGTASEGSAATWAGGKADFMKTAHFHSFKFACSGDYRIVSFDAEIVPKGKR